jgi:hypothetical protein
MNYIFNNFSTMRYQLPSLIKIKFIVNSLWTAVENKKLDVVASILAIASFYVNLDKIMSFFTLRQQP